MKRSLVRLVMVAVSMVVVGGSVCLADTARLRDSFETQIPGTSILDAGGWVGTPEAQAVVSNALYNLDSYGGYLLPGTHTNVVVFSGGITNVRPARVVSAVTHDTRVAVAIKAQRSTELTALDANSLGGFRFDADGLPYFWALNDAGTTNWVAMTNTAQSAAEQAFAEDAWIKADVRFDFTVEAQA